MKYKSDWPEAKERLAALWQHEVLDRPCLAIQAPLRKEGPAAEPQPTSDEARWTDPAYLTAIAKHRIENTWWGGEAIPSFLIQAGWLLCLGGTPRFSRETIWYDKRDVSLNQPSAFRQRPDDQWAKRYQKAIAAMADLAGYDDFLVGAPGSLPANDLMSMQMGTENFLIAMLDEPEWVAEAIQNGAKDLIAACSQIQEDVRSRHEFWYGNAGWMPFWAPDPFVSTQSDVSCMLSPEMFKRFILPEIDLHGQIYGALWYHLDGRDAKQHLPCLLSLPYLRVIQYVPTPAEPPNGIGHLDLYRAIQKAGKIVHIDVPWQQVEPLLRALDPSRLLMQTTCDSVETGERLLQQSAAWARRGFAQR